MDGLTRGRLIDLPGQLEAVDEERPTPRQMELKADRQAVTVPLCSHV